MNSHLHRAHVTVCVSAYCVVPYVTVSASNPCSHSFILTACGFYIAIGPTGFATCNVVLCVLLVKFSVCLFSHFVLPFMVNEDVYIKSNV